MKIETLTFQTLTFQVPEILSLLGLIQCVYLLVYMAFRAGDVRLAVVPGIYFLVLGAAFFLDFAERFIGDEWAYYPVWQWAAWFMGPPLSVLLITQVARVARLPRWQQYWVVALVPAAYIAARIITTTTAGTYCPLPRECEGFFDALTTTGLVAGGISLLAVWAQRDLLDPLRADKGASARFWLVVTLVLVNGAFLATALATLTVGGLIPVQAEMIRTIIGLGLVYLAGTSLFRIYPQSVQMGRGPKAKEGTAPQAFSASDEALLERIIELLDRDKVYQEASYSRSDLARELNAPEAVLSRIINAHFGKSFPQILNERRVGDAQRLLRETDAPVRQIAEDVGFNSTATFNRVFRDVTGHTPTAYRAESGAVRAAD